MFVTFERIARVNESEFSRRRIIRRRGYSDRTAMESGRLIRENMGKIISTAYLESAEPKWIRVPVKSAACHLLCIIETTQNNWARISGPAAKFRSRGVLTFARSSVIVTRKTIAGTRKFLRKRERAVLLYHRHLLGTLERRDKIIRNFPNYVLLRARARPPIHVECKTILSRFSFFVSLHLFRRATKT